MESVYDILLNYLPDAGSVEEVVQGQFWNLAKTEDGRCGIAMTTFGDSISPKIENFQGISASIAAQSVRSWNFPEASSGMAAINACYNTTDRMEALHSYEPYENYCTAGLDFTGKTVGLIGHLNMPEDLLRCVRDVFIIEKHPRPGDYPDSACEYLLPECDVVLITGSSLINKTLPRLLELSRNAYTILTGPTVPMCPELLSCNIQRLAGMIVSDQKAMKDHAERSVPGSPYPYGTTFLIKE